MLFRRVLQEENQFVISVVTVWISSPPAGTTHQLQRQPVHFGWEMGAWGGGGRTGTTRHLARRQREPERSRDGWREGGAQEEGGVIPEDQQHVAGMWPSAERLGWNAFSFFVMCHMVSCCCCCFFFLNCRHCYGDDKWKNKAQQTISGNTRATDVSFILSTKYFSRLQKHKISFLFL